MGFMLLLALRACLGFVFCGVLLLSSLILFEYMPNAWRAVMQALTGLGWTAMSIICCASLQAFHIHWRIGISAFTLVTGLAVLGPICLMPETPRWLFIKGYQEDGYRVFER